MATKTSVSYFKEDCYYRSAASPFNKVDTSTISKLTSSRTSESNPKWKQIIADGGNATTAMSAYRQYAKINPGYIFYQMQGGVTTLFGNTDMGIRGKYALDPITLQQARMNALAVKAEAIATAKVYARLTELQAPFQGQVFAGELREVLNMIRHPFAETSRLVQRFITLATKHKSFRSAVSTAKGRKLKLKQLTPLPQDIASAWLEFIFAIKPLLSDIADIIDLARETSEKRKHDIFQVYGKSVDSDTRVYTTNAGTTGINVRQEELIFYKAECSIKCGLEAKFLEQVRADTDHLRNSLDDYFTMPAMFWELMPWSFLVDYFINVGDIIGAASVGQSGIAHISKSIIRTEEREYVSSNPTIGRTDLIRQIHGNQPKRVVFGVRSVVRTGTLAGIPPVVFSLPGSKVRYANLLALLISLIK